jgi:hypothetical protein
MKLIGYLLALVVACTWPGALHAQPSAAGPAGGLIDEACTGSGQIPAITVTPASTYLSGDVIGGLITIPAMVNAGHSGILQSIRLNVRSVQTADFDVYQYVSAPTSTFTDRMNPFFNTADAFLVLPPIRLTDGDSGLGPMTVYGSDAITGARKPATQADWFVIITRGSATFTASTDVQFCAAYLF